MTERTVSYNIIARVNNYVSGMEQVRAATAKSVAAQVGSKKSLDELGQSMTKVGTAAVGAGALAAAGLAVVVKATADYQAKMAQLQTLSHASAAQMQQLSDAAMSAGKAYGFSASQVADAEIELTKAGVGVKAQLGGALTGALTLAAAGQIDVGQATEIATVAMTQFGLSAKDIPHLADLLSAGADKALGSVGDLGEALKNGGLQAHNMGLTIDDTVGTLAAFANQGIIGAEAGTQLRSMFIQLQRPSKQAKDVLDQYGISLTDSSGKFIGITGLAGELHDKLGGLTQANRNAALATVFGSHAIVGATALYQYGAKGVASWISQVNDSGFASAQAAGKLNSLQGDVQKLSASLQTDLIKAGTGANDMLRGFVQTGGHLLDFIGSVPQPVLALGTDLTALGAGVGLLGGAALIAVPKIAAMKLALQELNISGRSAVGAFGKGAAITAGVTAVVSGFVAMSEQGTATAQQIETSAQSMSKSWKGINSQFATALGGASGLKGALQGESGWSSDSSVTKWFDGFTLGITHLSDVYKTNEGQFNAMGQQFAGLAKTNYTAAAQSFASLTKQYGLNSDEQKTLLAQMSPYRDELTRLAGKVGVAATDQNLLAIAQGRGSNAAKVAAESQREAAASTAKQAMEIAKLQGSAASATTSVQALANTIKGFGSTTLDAHSAERAFQQAIDDASAAASKNGRTLKIGTQAGRDNQAALEGIASSAIAAASAVETQTGSSKQAAKVVAQGRSAFINQAEALGETRSQAEKYADQLGLIPKNVDTAVKVTGVQSGITSADILGSKLNSLVNGTWVVNVRLAQSGSINDSGLSGTVKARRANGGMMPSIGPKGRDSFIIAAGAGEYMFSAKSVDKAGGPSAMYRLNHAIDSGAISGFATGGAIGARAGVLDPYAKEVAAERAEVAAALAAAAKKTIKHGSKSAIDQATDAINSAAAAKTDYTKRLATAKKQLTADNKAAAAADKAYQKAQDAAANISGKGTAAAKHAAEMRARELKKADDAAKKKADSQQKTVDSISKKLDAATQKVSDQTDRRKQLQNDAEDFGSTQARATADNPIDPLSYVDQLRQMSRDSNYSAADQKTFDAAANKYEKSLVDLQTQASKAADALSTVKDASTQMASSITSSIAGGYQASNAASITSTSGWTVRNGIRFSTTSTGPTGASLAAYYTQGATDTGAFAAQLKQLASRGVNAALLAEIAGYGVAQGAPIAAALLSASDSQIAQINSGYSSIQTNAGVAGQTVADDNYAALIASDQAASDKITAQIASDGEALRTLIAQAFGLKGYASGTFAATPGLHPVAENGAELVTGPGLRMFRGGEGVWTASQTQAYIRGTALAGGSTRSQKLHVSTSGPSHVTIVDADGALMGTFQTVAASVADQRIAQDAHSDNVLLLGGPA